MAAGSVPADEAPRPPALAAHAMQVASRVPSLVGVVSATRSLDLLPQVEARLEQLKVRLGDRVEAGQVVAVLDTRTLQLDQAAHQAQLKAAEAELSRSTVLLQQAQQALDREKRIRDYTAAEDVERAEHAVALAAADVELAKAKLSEMQAQLALSNENLDRARIRAPFTGVVSEEYLQPGMMATRSTPIIRLVGEERLLRFAIPEALVGSVRLGSELRIPLEGSSPLQGFVERISPELDASSRHLKAEARLNIPAEARGLLPIGAIVPVELVAPSGARAENKTP
ncbi:MAG: efflux RND transporter periplasmic adaptor subunit [Hyalangium sp.]